MSSALVILGYTLFSIGILVNIFGCVGLVRMPDVYNRLQAATKCVTLGTSSVLLGTALVAQTGSIAWKAIICALFILLTSPTGAHAIAKGSYLSGIPLWGKVTDAYGPALASRGIRPAEPETVESPAPTYANAPSPSDTGQGEWREPASPLEGGTVGGGTRSVAVPPDPGVSPREARAIRPHPAAGIEGGIRER